MVRKLNRQARISKELADIINYIRAKAILNGKIPPSCKEITKKIAKQINKEKLLQNEFILFK